jgi:hypothetical protein
VGSRACYAGGVKPSLPTPTAATVWPRYDGGSLANLPPTIGRLLGVEEGWVAPGLDTDLVADTDEIERVVLVLLDGVGWHRLTRQLGEDASVLELLQPYHPSLRSITSVSPATTSVATTTLWCNGAAPAEHGMLGYTFLLPEAGLVANLLFWIPAWKPGARYGELESWGLKPEAFLPVPSIAQVLASGGVKTTAFLPAGIAKSPLSRLQMRGAEVEGYVNAADLWLKLSGWLDKTSGGRAYAYAYYPDFDSLSHRDGPEARFWPFLWRELAFHLEGFFKRLTSKERRGTLLLLTSDHGHVASPLEKRVVVQDHPDLTRRLALTPGGEARHTYLYARSGHAEAVHDYVTERLADRFMLLDAEEALAAGLYGPPERLHPETPRRLGDFILLPKGGNYLWMKQLETTFYGLHGGLEADEMLVPLLALRLDA